MRAHTGDNTMRSPKPAGFTLLELMIVVAVVAVLAMLALNSYTEQIRKGKRAEAVQALGDIQLREERWRSENPTFGDSTSASAAAGNLFGSTANVTAYNNGLKNYDISISGTSATAYTATATRKGDLANDPKCANFVVRVGSQCDGTAAPGSVNKCMSNNANVDYCWRR